ncbi:hypothetical protein PtB15_12B172 [Puccinia triticina]|nr:hypothetical protein PtB15_12B172 [Puccinia triticina]
MTLPSEPVSLLAAHALLLGNALLAAHVLVSNAEPLRPSTSRDPMPTNLPSADKDLSLLVSSR